MNCSQIWLIPVVDNCQCGYITLLKKHKTNRINHTLKTVKNSFKLPQNQKLCPNVGKKIVGNNFFN